MAVSEKNLKNAKTVDFVLADTYERDERLFKKIKTLVEILRKKGIITAYEAEEIVLMK